MAVTFDIHCRTFYIDGAKELNDSPCESIIVDIKGIEYLLKEFKRVGVIKEYNLDYFKQ